MLPSKIMQNQTTPIAKHLQQIADMLILNGTLTECSGLVHGKMGIATFFFLYAQHTDDELYADYSMDLIDELLNQIHVNSPADYEKGMDELNYQISLKNITSGKLKANAEKEHIGIVDNIYTFQSE